MDKKRLMAVLLRTAVLLICALALVSCSNKNADSVPFTEDELPDMVLYGASYTFGKPDRKPLILNAKTITIYSDNSRTELENIAFTQGNTDDAGLPYTELSGSCDSAVSVDNSRVTLSGNVMLSKHTDNVDIKCARLDWDDEKQSIQTDGLVEVSYKDGTHIVAEGFYALLDENIYEFSRIIEGRFDSAE